MIKLFDSGVYLINGRDIVADHQDAKQEIMHKYGINVESKEATSENTIAYGILKHTILLIIWIN